MCRLVPELGERARDTLLEARANGSLAAALHAVAGVHRLSPSESRDMAFSTFALERLRLGPPNNGPILLDSERLRLEAQETLAQPTDNDLSAALGNLDMAFSTFALEMLSFRSSPPIPILTDNE